MKKYSCIYFREKLVLMLTSCCVYRDHLEKSSTDSAHVHGALFNNTQTKMANAALPIPNQTVMRKSCNISKSFKASPTDPRSRQQHTIYLLKISWQPKAEVIIDCYLKHQHKPTPEKIPAEQSDPLNYTETAKSSRKTYVHILTSKPDHQISYCLYKLVLPSLEEHEMEQRTF